MPRRHRTWRLSQEYPDGAGKPRSMAARHRSEEHTSELQSRLHLVCRLLLEKKKNSLQMTAWQSHNVSCRFAVCVTSFLLSPPLYVLVFHFLTVASVGKVCCICTTIGSTYIA